MQFIIKIVNIFVTIIINKSLLISFILNKSKDFVIEVENYTSLNI